VALHVNSVEEFSAGDISSGDSSRDEEHFVRNVSRKALRRIISLKSPPIEIFFPNCPEKWYSTAYIFYPT
jgi:hypothetical protein